MKNKGFTLVEIIVVLILLTLIGFMVGSGLNNVFKTQKQKDFDTLVAKITSAADVYLADNTNLISELETRKAFLIIKVKDIIGAGLLADNLVNPETGESIGESNNTDFVMVTFDASGLLKFAYNPKPITESYLEAQALILEHDEPFVCDINTFASEWQSPTLRFVEKNGDVNQDIEIRSIIDENKIVCNFNDNKRPGAYSIKYTYTDPLTGVKKEFKRAVIIKAETVLITITFDANKASAIGSTSLSCSYTRPETSCKIMAPTITRESFTIIGWHHEAAATTSDWKVGAVKEFSDNATYYAITSGVWDFPFNGATHDSGTSQTFKVPENGRYKIELWGAAANALPTAGYTAGDITLNKAENLYIFVGGPGADYGSGIETGGWNGGGGSERFSPTISSYTSGGATDVRLNNGVWNDSLSLRSRIMVAAGGSTGSSDITSGRAGGLSGYSGADVDSTAAWLTAQGQGATQTAGGTTPAFYTPCGYTNGTGGGFGFGGKGGRSGNPKSGGGTGGSGGYYGGSGGSGICNGLNPGGGGSSYISGHKGSVAITSAANQAPKSGCLTGTTNIDCSIHYSTKKFENTLMIDGAGYEWTNTKIGFKQMPKPTGGYYAAGRGHNGAGHARIIYLSS